IHFELTPLPSGVAITSVADQSARWEKCVAAVAAYVLSQGSPRAAALLPQLLAGQRVQLGRLSAAARTALIRSGIAEGGRNRLRPVPEFVQAAARYREQFLRGELEASAYTAWLAEFLVVYLASDDPSAVRRGLDRVGLPAMLRAA
ncbi:MAG: hypothetical protein RJA70_4608, partial [Pseudomonadota bacterium]